MRRIAVGALILICIVPRALAVELEARSAVMRRESFQRPWKGYTGVRAGGSVGATGFGFWGFGEELRTQLDTRVRYGELSGIVAIGDWSVSGGGGFGSDFLYKPTTLAVADVMRRLRGAGATVYGGYTRSVYEGLAADIYQTLRFGWHQDLSDGWRAHGFAHALANHTESGAIRRRGLAFGAEMTHEREGRRATAGVSASCMADGMSCGGPTRDVYAETFLEGRLPLAAAYGLTGRVAYVGETGARWMELPAAAVAPYYYGSVQVEAGIFSRF